MSCEQEWWDYVGAVNAHANAMEQLARYAGNYAGWDGGLLSEREVDTWVQYVRNAEATLAYQNGQLERYFEAMREHGQFKAGCHSGAREHDL